jgi:hypothetical protein
VYSLSWCRTIFFNHDGELVTQRTPSDHRQLVFAVVWGPARHDRWRVAVIASQVEHVLITVVCGRVSSGHGRPHLLQRGAMADGSNVRHDTIVVPEKMSPAEVMALADLKAQAQVGENDVAFLHLHGSRPISGEHGTEVEWRYSYQVIPRGGTAADTAG